MKTLLSRLCFISLTLCLVQVIVAQAPPGPKIEETFSSNKKFSTEISMTRLDQPLLTVYRHEDGKRVQVWTRSLAVEKGEDEDPNAFQMPFQEYGIAKSVSDDGKFVILRSRYQHMEMPAIRILAKGGGDKRIEYEELMAFIEDDLEESEVDMGQQPHFLELWVQNSSPPQYAIWNVESSKWLVVDLEKLTLNKADDAASKKLDALCLPQAREIARQARPTGIKKLLQPVLETAAEYVPGIAGQEAEVNFAEKTEPAYRFLAQQKNPEDRKLIEALMDADLQVVSTFTGGFDGTGPVWYSILRSRERALGDELLTKWDGKPADEEGDDDSSGIGPFFGGGELNRLGTIRGVVKLPFAAPKNAEAVWIYLIPDGVSKWERSDEVLTLWHETSHPPQPGMPEPEPIDSAEFVFDTLPPGNYRLKAVWDRRSPHTKPGPKAMCLPEAGDYESVESAPVSIMAGKAINDIVLNCTNRVGNAEEYFAADERWKKQHPPRAKSAAPGYPWGRGNTTVLVKEPVANWLIKTNQAEENFQLTRIRLVEIKYNDVARKVLTVSFRIPKKVKTENHVQIEAKLTDEHGCEFSSGGGYSSSGRTYELTFQTVPFGAEELELVISKEDWGDMRRSGRSGPKKDVIASFTLKNLFGVKPADWKADEARPKRDLDLVTVELSNFDPSNQEYSRDFLERAFEGGFGPGNVGPRGRGFRPPENKFTFSADGNPAKGWMKVGGKFHDRWGNQGMDINGFCKEEEVFKYTVSFARDPEKGTFLAEERVEIPLERVPGPGENIAIGIQKEVQGVNFQVFSVSGTGEFKYKDGEFVSGSAEIEDEEIVPRFARPGRVVEPKLYLKGGDDNAMAGMPFGRGPRREVTLAAKIPHVACRIPTLGADQLLALLEQDTSVEEPMNAPDRRMPHVYSSHGGRRGQSEVQFLPLDFRSGDTNRKLTFIVQKTRQAEFFVRAPKNRPRSGPQGF